MHLEGRIKGILMCYETSMDVLNKRSLLTLVYVYIYILVHLRTSHKGIQFSLEASPPILIDFSKSTYVHARNTCKAGTKTDAEADLFSWGRKKGLSTVERSLDLELDLISYF